MSLLAAAGVRAHAQTRQQVSSDAERGCVGMCVCVSPTCHSMGGTAETVQFRKVQRLPPPCAMQNRVEPLAAVVQPGWLQRAPPPCRMQNCVRREHPFSQPACACARGCVVQRSGDGSSGCVEGADTEPWFRGSVYMLIPLLVEGQP